VIWQRAFTFTTIVLLSHEIEIEIEIEIDIEEAIWSLVRNVWLPWFQGRASLLDW